MEFELSDDMLEAIAGGVLDPETQAMLDKTLAALKKKGTTKDRAIEIFSKTEDLQLRFDTLDYIEQVWDSIIV